MSRYGIMVQGLDGMTRKNNAKFSLAFSFCCFLIYMGTSASTVAPGDAGDFLTALCTSGLPHPPGFPLYLILGKIFVWLSPGRNPILATNVLSALAGSAAAGILMLLTSRKTQSTSSGLLAGGIFAFSSLVWKYAVSAEVFALNNLFVAVLLLLFDIFLEMGLQTGPKAELQKGLKTGSKTLSVELLDTDQSKRLETTQRKWLGWVCFTFGIGLCNHPMLLFTGAPIVFGIYFAIHRSGYKSDNKNQILNYAAPFGFFSLGLLPYFYLFHLDTTVVTSSADLSNWDGFLNFIFRKQYGTFSLFPNFVDQTLGEQLKYFISTILVRELLVGGAGLSCYGIWKLWSSQEYKQRLFVQVTFVSFLIYFFIFFVLARSSISQPISTTIQLRFAQPILLILCLWLGIGFSKLIDLTPPRCRKWGPAFVGAILVGQILIHVSEGNQRGKSFASDFSRQMLTSLPQNSVLLLTGDTECLSVQYLQVCEKFRTDVIMLPRNLLQTEWMPKRIKNLFPTINFPEPYSIRSFLDSNSKQSNIFLSDYYPKEDETWVDAYKFLPLGGLNWISKNEWSDSEFERYLDLASSTLGTFDYEKYSKYPIESWEYYYYLRAMDAYSKFAKNLLLQSAKHPKSELRALLLADQYYTRFITHFESHPASSERNLESIRDRLHVKYKR